MGTRYRRRRQPEDELEPVETETAPESVSETEPEAGAESETQTITKLTKPGGTSFDNPLEASIAAQTRVAKDAGLKFPVILVDKSRGRKRQWQPGIDPPLDWWARHGWTLEE